MRQIITDVVDPIKEQLNRIYDSLNNLSKDFVRKDVYDAQQIAFGKDYEEFKTEMRGKSHRMLVTTASVLGLVMTVFTILQFLHII